MSSDSFMVLPTDVLGTEYLVPAWQANHRYSGSMIGETKVKSKQHTIHRWDVNNP